MGRKAQGRYHLKYYCRFTARFDGLLLIRTEIEAHVQALDQLETFQIKSSLSKASFSKLLCHDSLILSCSALTISLRFYLLCCAGLVHGIRRSTNCVGSVSMFKNIPPPTSRLFQLKTDSGDFANEGPGASLCSIYSAPNHSGNWISSAGQVS